MEIIVPLEISNLNLEIAELKEKLSNAEASAIRALRDRDIYRNQTYAPSMQLQKLHDIAMNKSKYANEQFEIKSKLYEEEFNSRVKLENMNKELIKMLRRHKNDITQAIKHLSA